MHPCNICTCVAACMHSDSYVLMYCSTGSCHTVAVQYIGSIRCNIAQAINPYLVGLT